ncbi:unnamed protein product [Prunus armeniaca]|uniref:Uncharacterized protein n=1 Tax=Prunus armeniaca TaxID=36596 RepID=A0A6J5V018_PRUAR|nr:unnamed protein product [Prunus armeniaca]
MSQPTTAAKLASGQDQVASCQDDLLGKISEMEKSLGKISQMEKSLGKIWEMKKSLGKILETEKSLSKIPEMEESLGQLFDLTKSITEELCLLLPIPHVRTAIPISTVIDGSPTMKLLIFIQENNSDVVAFHESRKRWNRVQVETSIRYAPFHGRAVVVGKTICALHGDEFIGFSFSMDKGNDDIIAYSLRKIFALRGLEIASPPWPFCDYKTEYLVHLGNLDFFHMKTGCCDVNIEVQFLCITTFQVVVGDGGRDMIKTINSTVHSVDIKDLDWFWLVFCFTSDFGDYEPISDKQECIMDENSFLDGGNYTTMAKKEETKQGIAARKLEEIAARQLEIRNYRKICTSNMRIQKPRSATT